MKEKGVIGAASDLVRVSFEYEKLANTCLAEFLSLTILTMRLQLQESTDIR